MLRAFRIHLFQCPSLKLHFRNILIYKLNFIAYLKLHTAIGWAQSLLLLAKAPTRLGIEKSCSEFSTACLLRKDLLEKINGYDEFFDYFLDETDVCLRLIQAGYEVHYADVTVEHYPQPSHNRIDQKHFICWYSLAKNTTYFAFKHGFKRIPFPIFVIRLTLLLTYRCLLRILRLKFTHRLPNSTWIKYIQQAFDGVRVGWVAGLNLHKVNFKKASFSGDTCWPLKRSFLLFLISILWGF